MDGLVDLRRIARVVVEMDADVVALQEVDRCWERSGGIDQVAELERLTGLTLHFLPTVRRGAAEYGIALATKGPTEIESALFPPLGDEEPRGYIRAEMDGVTIVATHLSRARRARAGQTVRLAELADVAGPVVVMGDMNQAPRHMKPLTAAGFRSGAARLPTLPSTRPRSHLDHVLAAGGARITQAWTPRTTASDHVPLVAVVEIPDVPPGGPRP
jgi:endonuclease/exonuclease/phosphatase family metal-dependent hydrolase